MLVRTFSHLIPHSDGAPTVLSSPSTSSYIPIIPCDQLPAPHHVQPDLPSNRQHRRMRLAPYPLSIATNALPSYPQQVMRAQQTAHVYSPRPIPLVSPNQVLESAVSNPHVHSPIAFTPGAHGTILLPFAPHSDASSIPNASFDELTATQMAYMQASAASSQTESMHMYSVSACMQLDQTCPSGSPLPQIQMPRLPSIPQLGPVRPLPSQPIDLAPANGPDGIPHLPDAIPPENSHIPVRLNGTLAPPSDTFPTPVELLGELTIRDAEAVQKDRRRAERRKAQMMHEAETLGYTPTDPDTISTHDKKRLYLDCLEQYVIYLHNQLRLAGHEPVPVERVSSGRGLTSRSIRTMIVHLKCTTAKLHMQKKEAERKYDELRAQLGAEAGLTAPSILGTSFTGMPSYLRKTSAQRSIRDPTTGPTAGLSSKPDADSVADAGPTPTPSRPAEMPTAVTVTREAHGDGARYSGLTVVEEGSIQPGYCFP